MNRSFHPFAGALLATLLLPPTPAPAANVYMVCGSDSTVWESSYIHNQYNNINITDPVFTSPTGNMAVCMSDDYRNALLDSAGDPITFTWWVQGGSFYNLSLNSSGIIGLELTMDYSLDDILRWGDEISYHYHTWEWSDVDGDGVSHWNQSLGFRSRRDDFDITLVNMIIDREIWPATFRSGWNTMDNDWNAHLDEIIPYRMQSWYPHKSFSVTEPVGSLYDWSHAVTDWVPYHPDPEDYQVPGSLRGWDTRCEETPNITQPMLDSVFAAAAAGEDQIVVAWDHVAVPGYPQRFVGLHNRVLAAQTTQPSVSFYYCTGIEAMQRWRGTTDTTPPELRFFAESVDEVVTLNFISDEPLYQVKPFVGVRRTDGSYSRADSVHVAPQHWQFSFNPSLDPITHVGVGATDTAGNPAAWSLPVEDFAPEALPSFQITQPNAIIHTADTVFPITWQDDDIHATGTISLFHDDDGSGFDGTLIADSISAYSLANVHLWDTTSIPEGTRYVYGLLDDGTHVPVSSYASSALQIVHGDDTLPPLAITDLAVEETSPGEITLSWTIPPPAADGDLPRQSLIYWSDESPVVLSPENLHGQQSGLTSSWNGILPFAGTWHSTVIGIDDAGNMSAPSNEVMLTTAGLDILPPAAVSDLSADESGEGIVALLWSAPSPALDGDIPVSYSIYRSETSPPDTTDGAQLIGETLAPVTTFNDTTAPENVLHHYVVIGADDGDNRSAPSNEVAATRNFSPVEFTEVWRKDDESISSNALRRITHNPITHHLLIPDVTDRVVHIVNASDGSDTETDMPPPAAGWVTFGPYGITIDSAGVIYCVQFGGNENLYRWQDETSLPTIAAGLSETGGSIRGLHAIGSGSDTTLFLAGDSDSVALLDTADGLTFTRTREIDTLGLSGRHDVWAGPTGTKLLCTHLLTGTDGAQEYRLINDAWILQAGFTPPYGGLDGIRRTVQGPIIAAHSDSNRVVLLQGETGQERGSSAHLGSGAISMDIDVDETNRRVYWVRDGLGYGCLAYPDLGPAPASAAWVMK